MILKTIELKAVPVILVEMPEKKKRFTMIEARILEVINRSKFLGFLSDLTEEQFAGITMSGETSRTIDIQRYRFHQILQNEQVYIGSVERPNIEDYTVGQLPHFNEDLSIWQASQARTIDPSRTAVLLREEEVRV